MIYIVEIKWWDLGANSSRWEPYTVEAASEREAIAKVKAEIGHSFSNPARVKELRRDA